jgi:GT2 family glycosyltransferase
VRAGVIIPVFGRHELTAAVLADLVDDDAEFDVWLVDNKGDFEARGRTVGVLRPERNLGWAGGCNYGVSELWERGFRVFVLLNNDVRLSPLFITGLLQAVETTAGDVVGPLYDHNWPHQRGSYSGPAGDYRGRARDFVVPFVDGTCMVIPRSVIERVGLLDEEHWPMHGWGCDKDYALRVRMTGGSVWVTERCYLNHLARQTAAGFHDFSEFEAEQENNQGMIAKWGPEWRALLYDGFSDVSQIGLVQERFLEL